MSEGAQNKAEKMETMINDEENTGRIIFCQHVHKRFTVVSCPLTTVQYYRRSIIPTLAFIRLA